MKKIKEILKKEETRLFVFLGFVSIKLLVRKLGRDEAKVFIVEAFKKRKLDSNEVEMAFDGVLSGLFTFKDIFRI